MSSDRRKFIQKLGGLSTAITLSSFLNPTLITPLKKVIDSFQYLSIEDCTKDELFWYQVRQAYTVSPSLINLNNGGVSPQPKVVQEAVERYNKLANEVPSYYMWKVMDKDKIVLRKNLANLAGCSSYEIAINRNASEALETVIFGLRLKAGDEIVLCKQDYPNMMNAWKQRERRDGIILKWLDFNFPIEDEEKIVEQYQNAFTNKTKLVHITHVINWTGQIMPVRKIADLAHGNGIEVLVDGAQSFALLDFKISDLHCDYFGTSLHKWLSAPFGTGLLYVKKEKIKNLYPLFAGDNPESDRIEKFENFGTRSVAIELAIGQAILFHEMIGAKRKQDRLQYLKNYWLNKVKDIPGVKIHTSLLPTFACAIGLFSIEGLKNKDIVVELHNQFRIHVTSINLKQISGIRVTPNVYTLTKELDILIEAICIIAKRKNF